MEQYISKSALVAETKRRIKTNKECMLGLRNLDYYQGKVDALNDTLSFLDTLEVKEVDLEKEVNAYMVDEMKFLSDEVGYDTFLTIAKHFFELGLKARTDKELIEEVYSHLDSIKDTADRMTSGNFMHHRAAIKYSANVIEKVLGLIGLKAQKGE